MSESALKTKAWVGESRKALTATEVVVALGALTGWQLRGDGANVAISKRYHFANYFETMAFVNALVWIAHRHDHHPELVVHYADCEVCWNTHDVGGLSSTDFECAAATDALLA